MTVEQIKALAKEIHEGNVNRGFWEGERTLSWVLMLIRTEMSEAVEADRKGRLCSLGINEDSEHSRIDTYKHLNIDSEFSTTLFKGYIKDTVEDELADTVIRILDASVTSLIDTDYFLDRFAWFQGYSISEKVKKPLIEYAEYFNYVMAVSYYDERKVSIDLATAFSSIIQYCDYASINIWWHVKEKLKYNATRPYKHGKKY